MDVLLMYPQTFTSRWNDSPSNYQLCRTWPAAASHQGRDSNDYLCLSDPVSKQYSIWDQKGSHG